MILDTSHALSRLAGMPSAIGPPTSFSEDFDAFYEQPTQEYENRLGEAYQSYIDRQTAATGVELVNPITNTNRFLAGYTKNPTWFDQIFNRPSTATLEALFREQTKELHATGKLLELPGDMQDAAKRMAAKRAANQAWTLARGEHGWFDRPGKIAGEFGGSLSDPVILGVTLLTLPVAAAQTLRGAMMLEAAIGGATEAAIQPYIAASREKLGQPYSVGEGLLAVGAGTVLGGVFGAGAHGAAAGLQRLVQTYDTQRATRPRTEAGSPPAPGVARTPYRQPAGADAPSVRMNEDAARIVLEGERRTQESLAAVADSPIQHRVAADRLQEVESALAAGELPPPPPPQARRASAFISDSLASIRNPRKDVPPMSLTDFVRQEGGILPHPDDLGALRAGLDTKTFRVLNKRRGTSLDKMARQASESGYLPEGAGPDDLVQALRADADRSAGSVTGRVHSLADKAGLDELAVRTREETEFAQMLRGVGLTPEDAARMTDLEVEARLFPPEPEVPTPAGAQTGRAQESRVFVDEPPPEPDLLREAELAEANYLNEARRAGEAYVLVETDADGQLIIRAEKVPVAEIERIIEDERVFLQELKRCAGTGPPTVAEAA